MLQEFDLMEGIVNEELSAVFSFDNDCPEYCTCITGGALDLRLEPCDGERVMPVLTLFVMLRLAYGSL